MEGRRRVARALRRKGVEVRSSVGLLVCGNLSYGWIVGEWNGAWGVGREIEMGRNVR